MTRRRIRLLVVDDSEFTRTVLCHALGSEPTVEIVGSAGNPYEARELILRLKPDVMTLDVEMPRMDGVEFLKRLMPQCPLPVIMLSSFTPRGAEISLDALKAGALDIVLKPGGLNHSSLQSMIQELIQKVKVAADIDVSHWKAKRDGLIRSRLAATRLYRTCAFKVIAIGASTGGPQALTSILSALAPGTPPLVIAQHLPPGFSKMLAARLQETSSLTICEAQHGDTLLDSTVYIAPGDVHMEVVSVKDSLRIRLHNGNPESCYHPSIDVLFESVARSAGRHAIGIILTGMGSDGSKGLKLMRDQGALTVGQDQQSSIVYGMAKAAKESGAVELESSLAQIPGIIAEHSAFVKT